MPLNQELDKSWEEWEIPREVEAKWSYKPYEDKTIDENDELIDPW